MDLKGITWPGNIYQKFEAMCLEVEEVMYQDTVKYLENQVQTVGSSVKKFYSEVMQDIRPPDYVDPVKVAAADIPLNPYSHTEIIKKPKVTMKRDLETIKKKTEDYKVVGDINADHELAATQLDCTIDHAKGDIAMRVSSNSYSGNRRGAGLYRRHSVNGKGNYKVGIPYKMSKETNLGSEFLSEATSFCQLSKESATRSASDGECDVNEPRSVDNSVCTSTAPVDPPDSAVNLLSDIDDPNLEISPKTHDTDSVSSNYECMESKTDTICGSVPDEAIISSEGGSDNSEIDATSNDIGLEIIERLDESKFEETCVLVDGSELQVVPQKKRKHKSYKKKLQEAFPLRMKSTRKKEYEKLAAQYSTHSSKQEEMEQHSEDVPDSEWELL
ncbi:hypothetical protein LIER_04249 [Lithospermum erythrorhizon]|uniref:Uncharacterized protein n=1 Tax=Lithospermum erythrorhizon TaxID=34254 RepID=A0AAV3NXB0_LITER